MNDSQSKREKALEELRASRIWASNAEPPLHRMLSRIFPGLRPPHYERFWVNALTTGPVFGLVWGIAMWLLFWRDDGMSVGNAVIASAFAGIAFGLSMAAYYRWSARRARLSWWEDL